MGSVVGLVAFSAHTLEQAPDERASLAVVEACFGVGECVAQRQHLVVGHTLGRLVAVVLLSFPLREVEFLAAPIDIALGKPR
jgi:hypothetical protein